MADMNENFEPLSPWDQHCENSGYSLMLASLSTVTLGSPEVKILLLFVILFGFAFFLTSKRHLLPAFQRIWAKTILSGGLLYEVQRLWLSRRTYLSLYRSSFTRTPAYWLGMLTFTAVLGHAFSQV